MGLLFKDDLLDEFGRWALAYIPFGGPDFGELAAVGAAVGDGDADAYYRAWIDAGDRAAGEAGEAAGKGRTADARDLFLRASVFYNSAYHPLYGAPTDPRLVAAYRKQIEAMNSGLALSDPPVLPLTIPFEGASMPAYFIPAAGFASEVRPLVIFTNGYDGTVTDMYFASAVAASRHGFHSLIFDGPGQGAMLYEQGVPIRPLETGGWIFEGSLLTLLNPYGLLGGVTLMLLWEEYAGANPLAYKYTSFCVKYR